jgi:hypothetical protein
VDFKHGAARPPVLTLHLSHEVWMPVVFELLNGEAKPEC